MLKRVLRESDLQAWLSSEDLAHLQGLRWLAYKAPDFLSLFVGSQDFSRWEAHWWSTASAFQSLTACRESIKMFFKDTGKEQVLGLTPCLNKKGLKMARLLGCRPLGFMKNWKDEVCLLSVKEK